MFDLKTEEWAVLYGNPLFNQERSVLVVSPTPGSRISGYSVLNEIPARRNHGLMIGNSYYVPEFGLNVTDIYIFAGNIFISFSSDLVVR